MWWPNLIAVHCTSPSARHTHGPDFFLLSDVFVVHVFVIPEETLQIHNTYGYW